MGFRAVPVSRRILRSQELLRLSADGQQDHRGYEHSDSDPARDFRLFPRGGDAFPLQRVRGAVFRPADEEKQFLLRQIQAADNPMQP